MISLKFLEEWYKSNCDGDWEHVYGITIETLDNPGWAITIDLTDTSLEGLELQKFVEKSDTDWFSIITKDKKLLASGDPQKLEMLILEVQKIFHEQ